MLVTLQTHHVYSTLKRRGNDVETIVSTWNTRGVLVEKSLDTLQGLLLNEFYHLGELSFD